MLSANTCEDIKTIVTLFTLVGAGVGFFISRIVDTKKSRRTEFNNRIDEIKKLIISTIDVACNYWSLNQDSSDARFIDMQETLKTSLTRINGIVITLSKNNKSFNLPQAENHVRTFYTIITSGDFETHNRKQDSSRCTHIRNFGVSLEAFLEDSKIDKTWWN